MEDTRDAYNNCIIQFNKIVFKRIVDVVKEFHIGLMCTSQHDVVAMNMMKDLYENYRLIETKDLHGKTLTYGLLASMCRYAMEKTGQTKRSIILVWVKIVRDMSINEYEKIIYAYLKQFFLGQYQSYQVIFEQCDDSHIKGRYYYICNITFKGDRTIMSILVQDSVAQYAPRLTDKISIIPGAKCDNKGYITFDVSNETLHGLATFLHDNFGKNGFLNDLEMSPRLSFCERFSKNDTLIARHDLSYFRNKEVIDTYIAYSGVLRKLYDATWY
jgi:hypothetical protein